MHGPHGIIPTRGQVVALRARYPYVLNEGFVGNQGFEYWFPRSPVESEHQLVILGGGREVMKDGRYENYETDDSVVVPEVGAVLRKFLPAVFPGRFEEEGDGGVEMEWVS